MNKPFLPERGKLYTFREHQGVGNYTDSLVHDWHEKYNGLGHLDPMTKTST